MTAVSESVEGVYLHDLDPGSVLDVETKSRRYKIKYVGGDEILISGHPSLCPSPVSAKVLGSLESTGEIQFGFLGRGMRLAFRRLTDDLPVITSAIRDIHQEHGPN
jgi:hypothetical protein